MKSIDNIGTIKYNHLNGEHEKMTKRTFNPHNVKHKRGHGYRARLKRTLQRRMRKGRKRLVP